MLESSFTLLREIGTLVLESGDEVRFSIDAYHGFRYVSVRRYLKTDTFTGATRDGVTLTPEIVHALVPRLINLPKNIRELKDGIIGKFAKRPGICIVASVATIKGRRVLDLRQWQEDSGWTKKGIWLPLEKLPEINDFFQKTLAALDEKPTDDF